MSRSTARTRTKPRPAQDFAHAQQCRRCALRTRPGIHLPAADAGRGGRRPWRRSRAAVPGPGLHRRRPAGPYPAHLLPPGREHDPACPPGPAGRGWGCGSDTRTCSAPLACWAMCCRCAGPCATRSTSACATSTARAGSSPPASTSRAKPSSSRSNATCPAVRCRCSPSRSSSPACWCMGVPWSARRSNRWASNSSMPLRPTRASTCACWAPGTLRLPAQPHGDRQPLAGHAPAQPQPAGVTPGAGPAGAGKHPGAPETRPGPGGGTGHRPRPQPGQPDRKDFRRTEHEQPHLRAGWPNTG